MGWFAEGALTIARQRINTKLHNPYAAMHPVLYFLGLQSEEGMSRLGRRGTAAYFGGNRIGPSQKKKFLSDPWHEFSYVKRVLNAGKTLASKDDTLPVANDYVDDLVGRAKVGWTFFSEPVKIRQKAIDEAKSELGLRSLVEEATDHCWEAMLTRVNTQFRSGTLTLAQQLSEDYWGNVLGLNHVMTANNAYGGVNRAVETQLNPLVIDASTDLESTQVDLKTGRIAMVGNGTITGRAGKMLDGMGPILAITTPALWQELADQADGSGNIWYGGMPDHAVAGFKYPIIQHDQFWYIAEDSQPSGTTDYIPLDTVHVEVDSSYNFQLQPWVEQHKTIAGSKMEQWSNLNAKIRLVWEKPWLMTRVNNQTTG